MDNFLHLMFWENVVGGLKVKGDGINVTEVVGRVILKKIKVQESCVGKVPYKEKSIVTT